MAAEESIELRMASEKSPSFEEEAFLLERGDSPTARTRKRNSKFYLIVMAATLASFAASYDVYAPSSALPIMSRDLDAKGNAFWIASAAQLTSLAFTPLASGAADVWGRRVALLATLAFFIVGNLLSAVSWNLSSMVLGRGIQGVGVAALLSLPVAVIGDICTMQERAVFMQFIGGAWALGAFCCPLIGGWAADTNWRLLFWLAVALGLICFVLIWRYLDVKVPDASAQEKLWSMDWIGLGLFVGSITSILLALNWAGAIYAWTSWRIVVLLTAGIAGFALFAVYEGRVARKPLMPSVLFTNRTAFMAYIGTAIQTWALAISVYFVPIYWQAARGNSASRSGALLFPLLVVAEVTGILTGFWLAYRKRYWSSIVAAWPFMIIGAAALASLTQTTPVSLALLAEMCFGIGLGTLADVYLFPVLSSFPDELAGAIVGLNSIFRASGSVLIVIGSTILSNQLLDDAPSSYLESLSRNADNMPRIEFAAIARIAQLPDGERGLVQDAYAKALGTIWWLVSAMSVVGLLSALAMESLPFREDNTGAYGIRDDDEKPE